MNNSKDEDIQIIQTYHNIYINYNISFWSNLIFSNSLVLVVLSFIVSIKIIPDFIYYIFYASLFLTFWSIFLLLINLFICRRDYAKQLLVLTNVIPSKNFKTGYERGKKIRFFEIFSIGILFVNIILIFLSILLGQKPSNIKGCF